jgi:hypothetical protein
MRSFLYGNHDSRRVDGIAGWKRSNPGFHRRKLNICPIKTAAFTDQKSISPAKKPDLPAFSSDFQRPNLTMWDISGRKVFHRR